MRVTRYKTILNNDRLPVLVKERAVNYIGASGCIGPRTVCAIANDVFSMDKETEEHILLFCTDIKSHLIGVFEVSHGTCNASVISPKEVYTKALLCGAAGIILVHNHPSGDPSPSKEDYNVTKRVKETGELVGIPLTDHVIVGEYGYYSFHESGTL